MPWGCPGRGLIAVGFDSYITKLKFYYNNFKNAVETAKIAVDSCYDLRQFLTPLPSIDFREIRGLTYIYV
jgi:hypothetical protein